MASIAIQGVMRGNKFALPKINLSTVKHINVPETFLAMEAEGIHLYDLCRKDLPLNFLMILNDLN